MFVIKDKDHWERPFPHLVWLQEKTVHQRGCMSFVTYCNIYSKCYINLFTLFNIVADGKRSSNVLANAMNYLYTVFKNIKKIKNDGYSFLWIVTTSSSSSAETTHVSLSFSDRFNVFTISPGIVVLRDFECDACRFAVDSTSNNFIPPYLLFFVYIFVNILYIFCLHLYYM